MYRTSILFLVSSSQCWSFNTEAGAVNGFRIPVLLQTVVRKKANRVFKLSTAWGPYCFFVLLNLTAPLLRWNLKDHFTFEPMFPLTLVIIFLLYWRTLGSGQWVTAYYSLSLQCLRKVFSLWSSGPGWSYQSLCSHKTQRQRCWALNKVNTFRDNLDWCISLAVGSDLYSPPGLKMTFLFVRKSLSVKAEGAVGEMLHLSWNNSHKQDKFVQ